MPNDPQPARAIFWRIVELPVEKRAAALDRECGQDVELRLKVEALLSAESGANDSADGPVPLDPTLDSEQALPVTQDSEQPRNTTVPDQTAEFTVGSVRGSIIAQKYVLQQKIGEGGMGEVWSAKQTEPVKRTVALKLIKAGMDSKAVLQRFEQERQALALMDHPNIARVFDAGVTESGQPFFVMELVRGLSLTRFADENTLTTNQRLELFVPICNAIQHAHQKGIVHRDLKPANILVSLIDGKPVPKVIDFGVAKATGGKLTEQSMSTQFGALIGTLEYMSPEQAGVTGGDVDTRADIYSLGVVLYELLTGLRPIDATQLRKAGLAEMIRVIQEDDPCKPSTRISTHDSLPTIAAVRRTDPKRLTSLLRGELDWVIMKCLEKSRDRRYETANALGRDIDRFLSNEAVEARPTSTSYRLRKFVRRNQGPVTAAGLLLLALTAGMIGTAWGLIEARNQTSIARQQMQEKEQARAEEALQRTRAQKSEQAAQDESAIQRAINHFLREDILAQASTYAQGSALFEPDPDLKVKTALDRAALSIDSRFHEQPLVSAAIRKTIGVAYFDLGEYSAAEPHLQKALELYRKHQGNDHPNTLQTILQLGKLVLEMDQLAEAEQLLTEAAQGYQRVLGAEHRDTLRSQTSLAFCYQEQGARLGDEQKTETARVEYLRLLDTHQRLFGADDPDSLEVLNALAMLYRFLGSDPNNNRMLDNAEETVLQVLQLSEHLEDSHPLRLKYLSNLALVASDKLEFDRALAIREKVLAGCRRGFGDQHPNTARAMDGVASMYAQTNKMDEAERLYLASLDIRRQHFGNDHTVTQHAVFSIAQFYYNSGKWDKAEVYYRERLERNRRLQGENSINTHLASRDLALVYLNMGRNTDAEKLLDDAIEGLKKYKPDDDPILVLTREYQADLFMELGRYPEALAIYRNAVKQIRSQPTPPPIHLASALSSLGGALLLNEDYVEAEAAYRESTALFTQYLPEAWPTFVFQIQLGVALAKQQESDEAERLMLAGYTGLQPLEDSVPRPLFLESLSSISEFYKERGQTDEFEKWQRELELAIGQ